MEIKNLVKMNLKSLQELKEKATGADLETINKVMETVREKYRKKNGATKGKSGGSSNSSTSGSSTNADSQVWTAPSDTECRKTTTLNEAMKIMKNYKPRQKLVPKSKKRPDPIEKEVPDMVSMYLQDEKKIVNKVIETSTVNPDNRFDFLKNYDILSITFQVIHK
jgi:hypothetical protein